MPNIVQRRVLTGVSTFNKLVIYIGLKLPLIPASQRSLVAFAAISSATGQGYTPQSVIDTLSTLDAWWSFEVASCSQDTAGVTPSTIGGVIGRCVDWISGLVVTQASTSFKPTLRSNGADFDTVDDFLQGGNILNYASSFWCMTSLSLTSAKAFQMLFTRSVASDTVNFTDVQWEIRANNANTAYQFAGRVNSVLQTISSNSIATGQNYISSVVVDSATGTNFFNNGSALGSGSFSPAGTINPLTVNFTIGARSTGTFSAAARIRSAMFKSGSLSTSDRQKLERFLDRYWSTSLIA